MKQIYVFFIRGKKNDGTIIGENGRQITEEGKKRGGREQKKKRIIDGHTRGDVVGRRCSPIRGPRASEREMYFYYRRVLKSRASSACSLRKLKAAATLSVTMLLLDPCGPNEVKVVRYENFKCFHDSLNSSPLCSSFASENCDFIQDYGFMRRATQRRQQHRKHRAHAANTNFKRLLSGFTRRRLLVSYTNASKLETVSDLLRRHVLSSPGTDPSITFQ